MKRNLSSPLAPTPDYKMDIPQNPKRPRIKAKIKAAIASAKLARKAQKAKHKRKHDDKVEKRIIKKVYKSSSKTIKDAGKGKKGASRIYVKHKKGK